MVEGKGNETWIIVIGPGADFDINRVHRGGFDTGAEVAPSAICTS